MTALPVEHRPRPQRVAGHRLQAVKVSQQRTLPAVAPDTRRAPFIALVLLLIGAGLIALLVLNTAIAADSFVERSLNSQIEQLALQEQHLRQEVNAAQAPAALARAAAEQGMIPNSTPGFLVVNPDGTTQVIGAAKPAARPAPPVGNR